LTTTNFAFAVVGILYKNQGRDIAIRKGLELVAPKMTRLVDQAMEKARDNTILVHCWRGGMRSSSVAWLFETAGLKTFTMEGGYKAYRSFIRQDILNDKNLIVLGGLTGSGKTKIIKALAASGEPVVDLEGLANHRGSVFGAAGLSAQPSTEQFENDLYEEMQQFPAGYTVWVEDESKRIGSVYLPDIFYNHLRNSPVIFVGVSDKERSEILVDEYGSQPEEELAEAIMHLRKRLGGLLTQQALDALANKDYHGVVALLLPYYDKLYTRGLYNRQSKRVVKADLSQKSEDERIRALAAYRLEIEKENL